MNYKKIGTIVVILFVSIGIVLYFIFGTFVFEDYYDDPNIKAIDYNLEDAEQLLENFGFNKRFGCSTIAQKEYNDTYKAIISIEHLDSSKIKQEECSKIFKRYQLVSTDNEEYYQGDTGICKDSTSVISYDDLNAIYKSLYEKDLPKKNINSLDVHNLLYVFYDYIPSMDSFVEMKCNGCGGSCYSDHIRKIKFAYRKDKYLIIIFYDYESGLFELNDDKYFLNTSKASHIFKCTYNEECMNIIKEQYMDDLDEYEVVFEEKENSFVFKTFFKKEVKKIED